VLRIPMRVSVEDRSDKDGVNSSGSKYFPSEPGALRLMVPERGLIAIGQNQNQTVIAQSMVSIFVAVILRKQESSGFWIPGRASLARNDDPTPEAVTIMCFEGINKRLRGVLLSLLGGNAQALRAPGGAKAGREVKRDLCHFSTLFFRFALSKNNFRPPSPNHIL
jgi:hypothetical protein